jgi:hypothetical protein
VYVDRVVFDQEFLMLRSDSPRSTRRARRCWHLLILLFLLIQHVPLLAAQTATPALAAPAAGIAQDFPCEAANATLLPRLIAGSSSTPSGSPGPALLRCNLALERDSSKTVDIASLPTAGFGPLSLLSGPAHGVASWANGTLIYTPTAGYLGLDSITYGAGAPPEAVGEVRFWVQAPVAPVTPTVGPPSLIVPSTSFALLVARTPLGAGDEAVRSRLAQAGFAVTVKDYRTVLAGDAGGKALIVISSTVQSAAINASFRDTAVPLLTWEHGLYDDLALTGASPGGDYGVSMPRTTFALNTPIHPLATGLRGSVVALATPARMAYGTPGAGATRVAALPWPAASPLFVYESGAPMVGRSAPARRAGFFFDDDSPVRATAAGWRLFDETVYWLIGLNHPPKAGSDTLTVLKNGSGRRDLASLASDVDGDPLAFTLSGAPLHGVAKITGSTLAYTPTAGYTGADQLTYTVSDGRGGVASAQIAIRVIDPGPPIVTVQATQRLDLALTIEITGTYVTPEGGNLLIVIDHGDITSFTSTPPGGTGTVTETHTYAAPGTYTITMTVTQPGGGSSVATTVVTVNASGNRPAGPWRESPSQLQAPPLQQE